MLNSVVKKVFGSKGDRELKKLRPIVEQINSLEPQIQKLSDEELVGQTQKFKEKIKDGASLDQLLPEAFATVREASVRVMGMRHYDVQLIGGIVLHRGSIAEMKTGEGKTLTATLPVYLNALTGKGVHLITVNDYLAKRDAEWMGKIYRFLGLTVGTILHGLSDQERQEAYNCDITYGTNNEFGFDYLRDNMKYNPDRLVQRGFNYSIVDEVDSVLIDEARTPLIISGPAEGSVEKYYDANKIVAQLKEDDYSVDEKDNHALFTEEGISHAEKLLGIENLYDPSKIEILHCLEQSLKAYHLFKRDYDYVVEDNQVVIIDSHTGRKMPGRRYSDGLHQALEAKEGVNIEQENQTLASVTFQNFFRMYDKLSGMTGTAETEATEFHNIYKLECFVIPTNRPLARRDLNDQIYPNDTAKLNAIVDEIKTVHQTGRPILVGTIGIDASEIISRVLEKQGIRHTVLNAKFHEKESEIVAQAGRLNAVTIATNMAGRGTDIILGGNPEMLAKSAVAANPTLEFEEQFAHYKSLCEAQKKQVLELGGLCIIGTERHDSRRIDNQLRGRSGRQGDPGSSQFFLSMEDNLMRLFSSDRMKKLLIRNMEDDQPIEHKMVNKAIQRAQKSVENRNFEVRKHLLEYDDVMNVQRKTFYDMRKELLYGDPRTYLTQRIKAIASALTEEYRSNPKPGEEDQKRLEDNLAVLLRFKLEQTPESFNDHALAELPDQVFDQVTSGYSEKWDVLELPEDVVRDQERFIMLYIIDLQWKDHMRSMDYLKQGISLQGYAQKDPLIEYKKASYDMFNALMDRVDEEVVKTLVNLQPRIGDESVSKMRRTREKEAKAMRMSGGEEENAQAKQNKTFRRATPKVGRNEKCPCGSGKKYKNCHGRT